MKKILSNSGILEEISKKILKNQTQKFSLKIDKGHAFAKEASCKYRLVVHAFGQRPSSGVVLGGENPIFNWRMEMDISVRNSFNTNTRGLLLQTGSLKDLECTQ